MRRTGALFELAFALFLTPSNPLAVQREWIVALLRVQRWKSAKQISLKSALLMPFKLTNLVTLTSWHPSLWKRATPFTRYAIRQYLPSRTYQIKAITSFILSSLWTLSLRGISWVVLRSCHVGGLLIRCWLQCISILWGEGWTCADSHSDGSSESPGNAVLAVLFFITRDN